MHAPSPFVLSMGTRPEIIKMAPVYHHLKSLGYPVVVVHTGQHSDMAHALYRLFDMAPDHTIVLERHRFTHDGCELADMSGQLLKELSLMFHNIAPAAILVHGDTSSALMAAMAAFYLRLPIGHVEAGLRSHHEYSPFPEEKNRVLISQLAHWHFAPSENARANLLREGVPDAQIHVVGNSIVDAVMMGSAMVEAYHAQHPEADGGLVSLLAPCLTDKRLVLVTAHRRENHGHNIAAIARSVGTLLEKDPALVVVWPVHPNPQVAPFVEAAFAALPAALKTRLFVTPPLEYPTLLWILKNAWLVMTDSGGIQEEAIALHKPILVLRDTTERPEIIDAGAALLIGTEEHAIVQQVEKLLRAPEKYQAMCRSRNPYGNGRTAQRIGELLLPTHSSSERHACAHC